MDKFKKFCILTGTFFICGCGQSGVLNKDIVYNATDKGAPGFVVFSHKFHVKLRKQHCSYCHPKPFEKKTGKAKFTMKDIWAKKLCGKCHNGSVSFDAKNPENCIKCHHRR